MGFGVLPGSSNGELLGMLDFEDAGVPFVFHLHGRRFASARFHASAFDVTACQQESECQHKTGFGQKSQFHGITSWPTARFN